MRHVFLLTLAAISQLVLSANDGIFICRRVESAKECGAVVRMPKSNSNSKPRPSAKPRTTLKPRTKPRPKPTANTEANIRLLLEKRLKQLEARVERLEDMRMDIFEATPPPDVIEEEEEEETCPVFYKDKCFAFVEKKRGTISLKEAENKCKELNGHLANIYDQNHFELLEDLLRQMMGDEDEAEYFIIGMTYQKKTRTVLQKDGSPGTFVKWYSPLAYPDQTPGQTQMQVQVNKLETSTSGMYNVSPRSSARSALCEYPPQFP